MSAIRSRGRRGATAVPNWRCEDTRLDVFDFRVAVWLASHADVYLVDAVTRNAISRVIGISRERVSKALEQLVLLRIITVSDVPNIKGGKDRFEIVFDFDIWEREPEQGRHTSLPRTPDDLEQGRQASSSIGEQEEGRELSKESSRGEIEVTLYPPIPRGKVEIVPSNSDPANWAVKEVRKRNELFDACVEACGWEYHDMTERARRATGVAVAELKRVGATGTEVLRRAQVFKRVYPNATLTPNALANQWAAIAKIPERERQNSHSTDALLNVARKRGLG